MFSSYQCRKWSVSDTEGCTCFLLFFPLTVDCTLLITSSWTNKDLPSTMETRLNQSDATAFDISPWNNSFDSNLLCTQWELVLSEVGGWNPSWIQVWFSWGCGEMGDGGNVGISNSKMTYCMPPSSAEQQQLQEQQFSWGYSETEDRGWFG